MPHSAQQLWVRNRDALDLPFDFHIQLVHGCLHVTAESEALIRVMTLLPTMTITANVRQELLSSRMKSALTCSACEIPGNHDNQGV